MKVVLINTSEERGGAAIACRRLACALRKNGAEVTMLVGEKHPVAGGVVAANGRQWAGRLHFLWERFVVWVNNGFSRKNLFSVSLAGTGQDISRHPVVLNADVIHLHWINGGFLSLKDVRKLMDLGKPVVWTLHDMWMLTGICHHAGACEHYKAVCRDCPLLRFPFRYDLSNRVWKKKEKMLAGEEISFVACSRWLREKVLQSALLKQQPVIAIPNPIDTDVFRVTDKRQAREKMGLPADKYLLLFGAERADRPMKGIAYLIEALRALAEKIPDMRERIEVVIFGKSKTELLEIPFQVHYIGYVKGQEEIVIMYNAVDLYITPSLEDNLPNTVMEAMACGVPVVGFHTGGIPEMVDHNVNGYIAKYKDSADLMQGIYRTLFGTDIAVLSRQARQKVLDCYTEEKVAAAYLKVYTQLCGKI